MMEIMEEEYLGENGKNEWYSTQYDWFRQRSATLEQFEFGSLCAAIRAAAVFEDPKFGSGVSMQLEGEDDLAIQERTEFKDPTIWWRCLEQFEQFVREDKQLIRVAAVFLQLSCNLIGWATDLLFRAKFWLGAAESCFFVRLVFGHFKWFFLIVNSHQDTIFLDGPCPQYHFGPWPSRNLKPITKIQNPSRYSKQIYKFYFRWWPMQIKKTNLLMGFIHQENVDNLIGIANQLIYYPWCLLSILK